MKPTLKISILLLLLFFANAQYPAFAQSKMAEQISNQADSIFNLLTKETNVNKKEKLIISFYIIGIDAYPLPLQRLSQKLLDLARKNNDLIVESAAYSVAGQGYRLNGNYVRALEFHRKAVSLAEQSGSKFLQAMAIQQMAHIYKDRLENEKALILYREALQLYEESDKNFIWWASVNIGYVYFNMNNYDSALYYIKDGIERINSGNSAGPGSVSVSYATLAGLYSKNNKPDSAAKYFDLAFQNAFEFNSPRYFNIIYLAFAEHFSRQQQYDSSAYYYKKALEVVNGTEMSSLVLKPAKGLIDYYQNINADSTVKYWKVYSVANDSINSIRTNQQIQMLTFEEEQRRRDIEAAQVAYQNKIRTGLLLGGLAVFSLVAIILYRNNRQKQKANKVLEETLINLKSTQSQLIQSEKMASLGELTAGIAHEIQNPLNFVNNFSEVNTELIEEMKLELKAGNNEDAIALANDIAENEQKINHHGKRADAIVKGMLQHSRSSTGVKEPTDINALADEYFRLAYHGLRAKDKSFNATMITDFDETMGNINIVPQDIGRVILNLITNAFYVVDDKKKSPHPLKGSEEYEPVVTVSTKRLGPPSGDGGKIEIRVVDNGPGIPQNILDKIFQPFFTTKPTGQGTGLGLSLSYDMIKAHGGELKVETNEGEGSQFIIILPA